MCVCVCASEKEADSNRERVRELANIRYFSSNLFQRELSFRNLTGRVLFSRTTLSERVAKTSTSLKSRLEIDEEEAVIEDSSSRYFKTYQGRRRLGPRVYVHLKLFS